MVCKCGATVKASAHGYPADAAGTRRAKAARWWALKSGRLIRNDRGALEGGDNPAWRRMSLAGALEQHPLLDGRRTHDGKTGQDLFPHGPEIARHQCHLL